MAEPVADAPQDAAFELPPPPLPVLIVLGLMFGGVAALHVYLGQRLLVDAGLPRSGVLAGWTALALMLAAVPAGMLLRRRGPPSVSRPIQRLGYFWLGAFTVLLTVTAAADAVAWAAVALVPRLAQDPLWVGQVEAAAIFAVGVVAVAHAYRVANGAPRVARVRVPIADLPRGFDGLRIVQLSDLHLGEGLGRAFLEGVVRQVQALQPDVVVITGDLVEGSVAELREHVEPLRGLSAPLGVYFVTGNHEYFWDGPAWEKAVAGLGITVLHNEHRVLRRDGASLVLGGITDLLGGQFAPGHAPDVTAAFAGAPEGCVRVLLAHQPKSVDEAAKAGVALQLSGHTHGGQIFPFGLLVRLQQPVAGGLAERRGVRVYTHQGTGFWGPPLRLGTVPEIAEITLAARDAVAP
jgi:hypothetical protein